jgi:hypothetical protein
MNSEQNQGGMATSRPDDVEGHAFKSGRIFERDEADVEGHAIRAGRIDEQVEADVEGHGRRMHLNPETEAEDDVEGHAARFKG